MESDILTHQTASVRTSLLAVGLSGVKALRHVDDVVAVASKRRRRGRATRQRRSAADDADAKL